MNIPVQRHMPKTFSLLFLIIRRTYTPKHKRFLSSQKRTSILLILRQKDKDRDKELVSSKDETLWINGQKL